MTSMYQTSDEGLRKVRYDLLRRMPLQELEGIAIRNPKDLLVHEVIKESFEKAKQARERYAILNTKRPFEGC